MLAVPKAAMRSLLETYTIDTLVNACALYADRHSRPQGVLYPGCGCDTSPSLVFPSVVYVDSNPYMIDALLAEGMNARCCYIQDFQPDMEFDLLLVIRFSVPPPDLRRLLRRGHVICDSYPADKLIENPDFAFVEDLEHPEREFQRGRRDYFLFRRRG